MSTGAIKLAIAGIIALGAVIMTAIRARNARLRLEQVNSGKICLHCDSTDVVLEFSGMKCNACGQLTSSALLGAEARPEDLGDMFKHENDLF